METKKIVGIVCMLPMILIVIGSFFASIYASYNKISGITYYSSAIIGVSIILYIIGLFLVKRRNDEK